MDAFKILDGIIVFIAIVAWILGIYGLLHKADEKEEAERENWRKTHPDLYNDKK